MYRILNGIYHSRYILFSILGYGIVVRVFAYLYNRSLWLDESMISLAIIEVPWSELLSPLHYGEAAPVGFVLITKIVVELFGSSEYALRLYPTVAGLLSVFVFYRLTMLVGNMSIRPLAMAFFSTSTGLISYANEVKQYSTDVLFCLALTTMAFELIKREISRVRLTIYVIVITISLWSSHASIFVVAGVGLVLLFNATVNKDWQKLYCIGILGITVGVNLVVIYFFHLQEIMQREFYFEWWTSFFAPFPLSSDLSEIRWYFNTFRSFIELVGIDQITVLGLVGIVLLSGIIAVYRKDKSTLFLLGAPLILLLVASWLKLYPMGNRLVLFAIPYALIVVAYGVVAMKGDNRGSSVAVPIIVAAILLGTVVNKSVATIIYPPGNGVREVVEIITDNWKEGDIVYVYYNGKPTFDYYLSSRKKNPINYIVGVKSRGLWDRYQEDLKRLTNFNRVWIFFSAVCCDEQTQFLNYLNKIGTQEYFFEANDGAAYLYSFK